MAAKAFLINSYKNNNDIISIVNSISNHSLTETSHDYANRKGQTIGDASRLSAGNYNAKALENPAMALVEVVLAANRNYVKVVDPYIKEARIKYPSIKTFDDLMNLMQTLDWKQFSNFWHHKDEKKYNTLKSILKASSVLKNQYSDVVSDYYVMNKWASNIDIKNYLKDSIGEIPNIATATIQHLRMTFGVDTVKPDQRVKEVLEFEFCTPKLSDVNSILAIEQIAKICGLAVLEVDQIFVNYGSGYYNRTNKKITQKEIAKKLKEKNIADEIIAYATGLTLSQLAKL